MSTNLTLEEVRQRYGESTPRRQFLFARFQTWVTDAVAQEHMDAMFDVFLETVTEHPNPLLRSLYDYQR